ncbi:hypothetical protein NPIL_191901, partial [Nephila pilipes]
LPQPGIVPTGISHLRKPSCFKTMPDHQCDVEVYYNTCKTTQLNMERRTVLLNSYPGGSDIAVVVR